MSEEQVKSIHAKKQNFRFVIRAIQQVHTDVGMRPIVKASLELYSATTFEEADLVRRGEKKLTKARQEQLLQAMSGFIDLVSATIEGQKIIEEVVLNGRENPVEEDCKPQPFFTGGR